jgi:hypothetical protein
MSELREAVKAAIDQLRKLSDGWSRTNGIADDLEAALKEDAKEPLEPILDFRCMCSKCEERTKETYKLQLKCSNCNWRGIALIRKGDKFSESRECPSCGVTFSLMASPFEPEPEVERREVDISTWPSVRKLLREAWMACAEWYMGKSFTPTCREEAETEALRRWPDVPGKQTAKDRIMAFCNAPDGQDPRGPTNFGERIDDLDKRVTDLEHKA